MFLLLRYGGGICKIHLFCSISLLIIFRQPKVPEPKFRCFKFHSLIFLTLFYLFVSSVKFFSKNKANVTFFHFFHIAASLNCLCSKIKWDICFRTIILIADAIMMQCALCKIQLFATSHSFEIKSLNLSQIFLYHKNNTHVA